MAGVSGTRSRGRRPAKARTWPPMLRARDAAVRARAILRLWRMGASDRLSAPPAMPISAWPARISEATSAMASLAEAHARFTVWAGTAAGSPARRTTSRARFGAFTEGMTCPSTTVSTHAASTSARSTSSRTQAVARSTAVSSR